MSRHLDVVTLTGTEYDALMAAKDERDDLRAKLAKPAPVPVPPAEAKVEASHPNCNYAGWEGRVCTKCGEIHYEVPPRYLFGEPDRDGPMLARLAQIQSTLPEGR